VNAARADFVISNHEPIVRSIDDTTARGLIVGSFLVS